MERDDELLRIGEDRELRMGPSILRMGSGMTVHRAVEVPRYVEPVLIPFPPKPTFWQRVWYWLNMDIRELWRLWKR